MAYIEFERRPLPGYTRIRPQGNQAHLGALEYVELRYRDDVRVRVYNKALDIFDPRNKPLVELYNEGRRVYLRVHSFFRIDKIRLRSEGEFHFVLDPIRIERRSLLENMISIFFGAASRESEGDLRAIAERLVPQGPLTYETKRLERVDV